MKYASALAGFGLFTLLLVPAESQAGHGYHKGYHVPAPPAYRHAPPSYPYGYHHRHPGYRTPAPRGDTYIIVAPRKSRAEQAYEDEVWLLETERVRQLRQNMVAPPPPLPSK